ncbi:MAG: hypothetical protein HY603_01210 [Parcubacteria group bacterium]|nr:hypothetical protein [Parcubacteria group bacterium]MBI4217402.1 hypothetical protein [Parcubacteria group bacterium]
MESFLIWGLAGGVLRGLVGYVKHRASYKDVRFDWGYFLSTVGISGIAGFAAAVSLRQLGVTAVEFSALTPAVMFVTGYAGGDVLENLAKIILKKP